MLNRTVWKEFFLILQEKNVFYIEKKGKKKSYCKEKIIISSLFSGDMAAAHVIANALYFWV